MVIIVIFKFCVRIRWTGRAKKLITAGKVSVDGRQLNRSDKGHTLHGGESVIVLGQIDGASSMSSTPASPALSAINTPDDAGGWDEFVDTPGFNSHDHSNQSQQQQHRYSHQSWSTRPSAAHVAGAVNEVAGGSPIDKLCHRLLTNRRHWLVMPYTSMS